MVVSWFRMWRATAAISVGRRARRGRGGWSVRASVSHRWRTRRMPVGPERDAKRVLGGAGQLEDGRRLPALLEPMPEDDALLGDVTSVGSGSTYISLGQLRVCEATADGR